MKNFPFILTILLFNIGISINIQSQDIGFPEALYTKAEKTQYTETSLHSDVLNFVQKLATSSELVHHEIIGTSREGRDIPIAVLANPGISSPYEAAQSGKPVIYIQANIHGGEVEGKEASMIMMREIAFGQKKYLLDGQIIIFCPVYNADGNDALSPDNRSNQDGSPVEAGERYSGEGLDLNRDGMKLESIEGKALTANVILKWNPIMFVDLHTTNGTWHGYPLTYAPGLATAGHQGANRYLMDNLFPEVTEKTRERSGIDTYLYGNFSEFPPKTYNGMLTLPRYLTNALALRNMFTILVETFAHDRFERRILSNIYWLTSLLEYTSDNATEMNNLFSSIQAEVTYEIESSGGQLLKGVQFQRSQQGQLSDLLVYDTGPNIDQFGIERPRRTGRRVWVSGVRKMTGVGILKEANVPIAYVFPAELENVANKLTEHGIPVEELSTDTPFSGDEFTVTNFNRSSYDYQGHNLTSLNGYFSSVSKTFPAGSYYVDMRQALAYLTFYLLEPETDDGLTVWNYFDDYLIQKGVQAQDVDFPVFKIYQSGQSVSNISGDTGFTIRPDQNQESIVVHNDKATGQAVLIKLTDSSGKIIKEVKMQTNQNSISIPMSGLSKGLYFISLEAGQISFTERLVWN